MDSSKFLFGLLFPFLHKSRSELGFLPSFYSKPLHLEFNLWIKQLRLKTCSKAFLNSFDLELSVFKKTKQLRNVLGHVLRRNFLIQSPSFNLHLYLQQVLPGVERISCDCSLEETRKEIAVAYCEDCKDNICETCYHAHLRVKLTKDHRISWFYGKYPILKLVRILNSLNSLKNVILILAPRHYKNKNEGKSLHDRKFAT